MNLNKLEHLLLSSMCNDREPLHALYSDAVREMSQVDVKQVIDGLLQLARLGLAKSCFYDEKTGRYKPQPTTKRETLLKHVAGRTTEELANWPAESFGGEYFFEMTAKGRKEEAKETYSAYYPDAATAGG